MQLTDIEVKHPHTVGLKGCCGLILSCSRCRSPAYFTGSKVHDVAFINDRQHITCSLSLTTTLTKHGGIPLCWLCTLHSKFQEKNDQLNTWVAAYMFIVIVIIHVQATVEVDFLSLYSRSSVARILMARLQRLFELIIESV